MKRLFVALLALTLAACAGLPYDAKPPRISVSEVDVKSLGLFEQRFDVGLRVNNPNDFDLRIEALEFDIEVNERPFAKGLTRTAALIPATTSAVMRVEAVTQSRQLIQQLKTLPGDVLFDGVPYRISGRVKTDRSSSWIPFEHRGVYGADEKKPKGKTI